MNLGNFLSNMRNRYQDAGIVLQLTFRAVPGGAAALTDVGYLPTWVDDTDETGKVHHQVIDIGAALHTCGQSPRLGVDDCARMEQALHDTVKMYGESDRIERAGPPQFTDPTGGEEAALP